MLVAGRLILNNLSPTANWPLPRQLLHMHVFFFFFSIHFLFILVISMKLSNAKKIGTQMMTA